MRGARSSVPLKELPIRYFTRGWASGDLTDDEYDRARAAYETRLAEIGDRLPADMLRLQKDMSLHDALIERVFWNAAKRLLQLDLVRGDLSAGYSLVQLRYAGAMLGRSRIEALERAALSRATEVLYDEVDVNEDGSLCHRILFWPCEEVTIDFARFEMTASPRPDRRVTLLGAFEIEEPETASSLEE